MQTNSEKFAEDGYLVVEKVLQSEDLTPLVTVIADVVDKRAHELHHAGTISDIFDDMLF